jgi:hypothetical protein
LLSQEIFFLENGISTLNVEFDQHTYGPKQNWQSLQAGHRGTESVIAAAGFKLDSITYGAAEFHLLACHRMEYMDKWPYRHNITWCFMI